MAVSRVRAAAAVGLGALLLAFRAAGTPISLPAQNQVPPPAPPPIVDEPETSDTAAETDSEGPSTLSEVDAYSGRSLDCEVYDDAAVYDACMAALLSYYENLQFGNAHRQASFEWQLWSSKVSFWITLGLLGTGVAFSGLQLAAGLKSPETKFKFLGLEISSSIVGLIILGMSLTYFYLYLAYVYPITEVG